MPLSITKAQAKAQKLPLDWDGDKVLITYNKRVVTPEFLEEAEKREEETAVQAELRSLAKMLLDWDLVDEDGKKLPISVESLRRLPTDLIRTITQAIWKDLAPSPEPSADSASTF